MLRVTEIKVSSVSSLLFESKCHTYIVSLSPPFWPIITKLCVKHISSSHWLFCHNSLLGYLWWPWRAKWNKWRKCKNTKMKKSKKYLLYIVIYDQCVRISSFYLNITVTICNVRLHSSNTVEMFFPSTKIYSGVGLSKNPQVCIVAFLLFWKRKIFKIDVCTCAFCKKLRSGETMGYCAKHRLKNGFIQEIYKYCTLSDLPSRIYAVDF